MRFEIKYFYYYLRDEDRRPFGCVCLGYNYEDCKFSRGISLCSSQDNFMKVTARKIAKNRCVHALKTKENNYKIKYPTAEVWEVKDSIIELLDCELIPKLFKFEYKSEYAVNTTPHEYNIVKKDIYETNRDDQSVKS